MGHEKKMPYFPLYKLLNRDPYNMVYYNPHLTGQYNPLATLNNQGFFPFPHGLKQLWPTQNRGGNCLPTSDMPLNQWNHTSLGNRLDPYSGLLVRGFKMFQPIWKILVKQDHFPM